MILTVYRWLLRLYPARYRRDFGAEMTGVFRDARNSLLPAPARAKAPALAAKISFYWREFSGLLSGALAAHFDGLFGPATPFPRFYMQPQFRFPRAAVLLMLVSFGGVVFAIRMTSNVAGDRLGSVWPALVSVFFFMLLAMSGAAAVIWVILHRLRRSGLHRLENVGVVSDGNQ